jgi:glucan phosphoethanolaminetransferase (alkaline phosphatase superfamily)
MMNVGFFNRIPVMPLVLLWLAYALLGWYLAAHHIIWLAGAFVAVVAIAIVRKSIAWLERLVAFGSRILVVILFLSISVALVETWSLFFSLFLIPIATTFLADLEMRFAGFNRLDSFWILTVLAVFGLVAGELIDILLLPSSRF